MKQFQPLIRACSNLIQLKASDEISTLCRRAIGICFNDGLALNLIDELRLLLNEKQKLEVQLPCLDAFVSKFNVEDVKDKDLKAIEKTLKISLFNLCKFVSKADSEAQFRGMFWDSVFTTLLYKPFKALLKKAPQVKFRLESEWQIKKLFQDLESRKVDFAALWSGIPLLIIEMGKEEFGVGINSHKDFTKSLGLISQSCLQLALKLESQGKRAENAKIFGIWVGGTQIHFITGRAIVSQTGDDEYSLHCNCYYPDKWKFDVMSTQQSTSELENKTRTGAVTYFNESSTVSPLKHKSDLQNLNLKLGIPPAPLNVNSWTNENVDMEKMDETLTVDLDEEDFLSDSEEVNSTEREGIFLRDNLNLNTLVMCDRFLVDFMNYIQSIESMEVGPHPPPARKFCDKKQDGYIPGSRSSSTDTTPFKERLKNQLPKRQRNSRLDTNGASANKKTRNSDNDDYYDSFYLNQGRSIQELDVYRKFLSLNPIVFPKLVEFFNSSNEEDSFVLVIEKMEPLLTSDDDGTTTYLSNRLYYKNCGEFLLSAVKFSLEILNGLDLLHSMYKIVHSDISPSNIMFSPESGIWKLNDFGDSMEISESESLSRVTGTSDYIPPESLETGIFTFASDIFSIGRVIQDVFYYNLLVKFELRSKKNDALFREFTKFESIVFDLIHNDADKRISTRAALVDLYSILVKFPVGYFDPNHSVYLRIGAIYDETMKLRHIDLEKRDKKTTQSDSTNLPQLSEIVKFEFDDKRTKSAPSISENCDNSFNRHF